MPNHGPVQQSGFAGLQTSSHSHLSNCGSRFGGVQGDPLHKFKYVVPYPHLIYLVYLIYLIYLIN